MIGKLIVTADDREQAIKRTARALEEFIIEGVKTTIPFHQKIMVHEKFLSNDFDTSFIEKYLQ